MNDTIQCEGGLGQIPVRLCVGRWKIANGEARATSAAKTKELEEGVCHLCSYGEARATGTLPGKQRLRVLSANEVRARLLRDRPAAPEVVETPAPEPGPSIDGEQLDAGELDQVPAEDLEPIEQPDAEEGDEPAEPEQDDDLDEDDVDEQPAQQPKEKPMRTNTCADCDKTFRVQNDTGRMPSRCPSCKGGAPTRSSKPPKPPKPARRVEPVAPKGGASATRTTLGELSLEDLIERNMARTALCGHVRALVTEHPREVAMDALAVVIGELRAEA